MCFWNELRRYFINLLTIRGRWEPFLTMDIHLMMGLLFTCIASTLLFIIMSIVHPFSWHSFLIYGSVLGFTISGFICYAVISKWKDFFPEQDLSHPNERHLAEVSWEDERAHLPLMRVPAELPETVGLSDSDFLMPGDLPELNMPFLEREETSEVPRTTPLLPHQKSKDNSPKRPRHPQDSSSSKFSFSERFNIRDFGISDDTIAQAGTFTDGLRRNNTSRSTDMSVEVHVGRDKESAIQHKPSPINIFAIASRYSPYELKPRNRSQPKYKKCLENTDQSDDSSTKTENIGTHKAPGKSTDYVSDKNFPSTSSSGNSCKSSTIQSEGGSADGSSSSPETSTFKAILPVATCDRPKTHEQFIELQKQQEGSKQRSVEMRDSLSSAASPTHRHILPKLLTKATSSFNTENKIKSKPYGRSNISKTRSQGHKEKKPFESKDDFSGSSSSSFP